MSHLPKVVDPKVPPGIDEALSTSGNPASTQENSSLISLLIYNILRSLFWAHLINKTVSAVITIDICFANSTIYAFYDKSLLVKDFITLRSFADFDDVSFPLLIFDDVLFIYVYKNNLMGTDTIKQFV